MSVQIDEPQFNPKTLEFHPLANLFPFMSKEDFTGLVEDMKANGYREDKPIWIYEGKILEGRNRHNAALQAGVTPTYAHYTGHDPITFVLQENLHRRHLTSSQKAVIALELETVLAEEAKKRQQEAGGDRKSEEYQKSLSQKIEQPIFDINERKASQQAAKALGTNRQYVSDAKKLQREAPELLEKVKAGKLTLSKAKKQLKNRQIASPSQTVFAVGDVVHITFPPELRGMEEVQLFNNQTGIIVEKTENAYMCEVDGKRTTPLSYFNLSSPKPPDSSSPYNEVSESKRELIRAIANYGNGNLHKALLKVSEDSLNQILDELKAQD